ncbi:MAG: MaoC/PaaZ C-terminal domain-containing protein [Microthrixaceae bacterium]
MFDRYYDELEVGDTREFNGVTITESHIQGFAGVTGDHYVLHTDAEYAKSTPFGQRVAHGLLVLSCGAGLIPLEPGRVQALMGMRDVKFSAPVFIGDTIHPEMEVLEKRDGRDGGVVVIAEKISNQRGEVVCSTTIEVLAANAPAA